jgi:AcrR family transcriptional regulator
VSNVTDLDMNRIAAAALRVADEVGASAFTMRAVADALDVTPMALYHYVEDKTALVALVVDWAIKERPLPPPTGDWREDLWLMSRWLRQSTVAHPAIARLRKVHEVWTPSILPMTERWYSIWQQSDLGFENAMRAATMSSMAIIGVVETEHVFRELTPPDDAMLAWLPNARTAFQRKGNPDRDFELVVRAIIDGIHGRLQNADTTSDASRRERAARPARASRSAPSRGQRR